MPWRDILVFADGTGDGLVRMRAALALAQTHQAHLEANVIVPLFQPTHGMNDDVFVHSMEELRRRTRERADDAVARLRNLAPDAADRVSVRAVETVFDDIRAITGRAARTADLVIAGQPEDLDRNQLDTEIFVGALLGGGSPCLMLPRWIEPHTWGRRVLIAWKGTPEAARALQAAMPLIAAAEAVRVCLVNPRGERHGEDTHSMARLAAYLARHGARVEEPVISESWEGPEKAFLAELDGYGADLLVMGAYSRPRLQEILFGGMTAAMVRHARVPILMTH
jgi:nucleotide-binding universal stress UspA family protein